MSIDTRTATRVVAISGAVGLALASAGFGAVFAYKVGIQHSILLAGLSILMAVALEAVKPLAIASAIQALREWRPLTAVPLLILGLIAIVYSLTAELSLVSMSKGDLVAERQAETNSAGDAERKRKRIEGELDAIGITRPSLAVSSDLNSLLADTRLKDCKAKLDSWRLDAICKDKVSPLRAELATAERRESLEAQLNGVQTIASKDADPGSKALATYLAAIEVTVSPEIVAQWLILVPVLALEIGSALGVVLVQAVSPPSGSTDLSRGINSEGRLASGTPSAGVGGPPQNTGLPESSDTTREKVKAAIVDHLKASGGSLSGGERGLAKALGSNRGTMKRALNGLVLAGIVSLEATRNGTVLRLVG
ncbi:hypothetical protein [uncultured Hyphomicrobium sp.]|jgi:hypothetical protein|uniref:hypothetical protein n=1 Tax=uncultured Hyphomicrobium sp. TaxID=194373 RepID=UPI0025CEDE3D|nr:hypothetical protein [uncultured Hyphomicrobium sp.]